MENGVVHHPRNVSFGQEQIGIKERASGVAGNVRLLSGNAKDVVDKARRSPTLLTFDEIPKWRQDNHFITGGYRPTSNSYIGSFSSLGYLHNEFVNIYTHGLGAIFYLLVGIGLYFTLRDRYTSSSMGDVLACGCFFLGALLCLGMSAIYHTITNHSPQVCRFGNALDYLGIVCLIAGSFVPAVYYGFYCDPHLQIVYWTMEVIIGLGCAIVSIRPEFRTPKWRPFRASMFVGMGLSSVVAMVHGCIKYGASQFKQQIRYDWMILEGFQYILGAALYAVGNVLRFKLVCESDCCFRLEYLNVSAQELSISGGHHTKFFTVWFLLPLDRI